jgi:hypothetical protein
VLHFTPYGFDGLFQAAVHLAARYPAVLLYVGPDQIMPLASVLSAIAGVALMFWHRLVAFGRMCMGVFRRRARPSKDEPPIEDRA